MAEDNHVGEEILTRAAKVWLRPDGIVQAVASPGSEVTLADAREILAAILKVSQGKRRPYLVDIRPSKSVDREARQEFAASTSMTAVAILIGSPLSRIIGNFFIGFNKAAVPLELFTSEAVAMEWLKGFRE